ncbi:phenylalanine--tRNA ligase subunit beta, partial [bacterium]|nr:phenylalanine--tRNA ligase subunit beta [bacterium]
MPISYNILKGFLDFDLSPEELGHKLTMSGSEMEYMRVFGPFDPGIKIGVIEEIISHPEFDTLFICDVNMGDRVFKIVTAAANIYKGEKVIVAPPKTRIQDIEIVAKDFGKVRSEGMLLSKEDLGYEEKSTGIWELGPNDEIGRPVADILKTDYVYGLEITPNRGDCLSHLGIARELSALLGKDMKKPEFSLQESDKLAKDIYTVEIQNPDDCPRYSCRIIEGVKIEPSPLYLQAALESIGIRAIYNVVDVTNYCMMLLNQPMHAFDIQKLNSNKIVVRRAGLGERMTTLDDENRMLTDEVLMITTPERPVAIAGIMGGKETEVDTGTQGILLESAYFDSVRTRRGSKSINLSTQSSQRFERGIDPSSVVWVADYCASMITEIAGGKILKGIIDEYPKKIEPLPVTLRMEALNSLLGIEIPPEKTIGILRFLGFEEVKITGEKKDCIECLAPTFRPDVTREADLIEEVGRIYGYENVEPSYRPGGQLSSALPETYIHSKRISEFLTNTGFYEITTIGFGKIDDLQLFFPLKEIIPVSNPTSVEYEYMRCSLKPTMLQVISYNLKQNSRDLRFFEVGNIYIHSKKDTFEPLMLCAAISGKRFPEQWSIPDEDVDIFDIKGTLENLFKKINIKEYQLSPSESKIFFENQAFNIIVEQNRIGEMGSVNKDILDHFEIDQPVMIFELDLNKALDLSTKTEKFVEINKFPAIKRDLVIIISNEIPVQQVLDRIKELSGDFYEIINLFDYYTGKPVPENKKSLGFSIIYRAKDRTLTAMEVNDFHQGLTDSICAEFDAVLPAKK